MSGSTVIYSEKTTEGQRRENVTMRLRFAFTISLVVLAAAAGLRAQSQSQTKTPEAGIQVTTAQLTGEVVQVEGNQLLMRMQPDKSLRYFDVQPGRQFTIDGQKKLIGDLKPGTILTATVVTKTQPITVRTTTVTNGTVWYVQGNFVILRLPNGDTREYNVPESFKFTVNDKPASVSELRKGMKVSGTRIVEEPTTEMSEQTVVTGTAPK
jgi:RNase P/RNase MRP subunit p29